MPDSIAGFKRTLNVPWNRMGGNCLCRGQKEELLLLAISNLLLFIVMTKKILKSSNRFKEKIYASFT